MEEEEPESEAIIDQAKPKALLYHYTDQRGLLGILRSQSIWATHIRYLNDSSEYNHVQISLSRAFPVALIL
jgi:hypothetical protein